MRIPEPVIVLSAALVLGCERGEAGDAGPNGARSSGSARPRATAAASAASASANIKGAAVAIPVSPEQVLKAVDPRGEEPYQGPSGTVRGTIKIHGDPPPDTPQKFTADCPGEASATYSKLFRVGQDGTVADVLVGVTGYSGFVPAREAAKRVTLRGCAASQRTIVVTYGQRIDIFNVDTLRTYMPYLDGGVAPAVLVAVPGGDAVHLYPQEVGHYLLRDELPKPWLTADVFALKYATVDVTGLDGRYQVAGVPVGKVKVSAFLPTIDRTVEKEIDVKPGENVLDLTLEYKAPAATKPADKK